MAVGGSSGDEPTTADARIATLEAIIADQKARILELDARILMLVGQVEVLTEKLGQNSKNSHRPPSSDGPGAGSGSRKPKSTNKRGGRPGHRGTYRQLVPSASVNSVVDLFPPVCLGCTADLPKVRDPRALRYQQLDLLDHRPHVTEYQRHAVKCAHCGARTRATYDASKIPSSAFGPRLTAAVGMLTGVYHLSRRKAQLLLRELFGISISLGALSTMERRASEALLPACDEALGVVRQAAVKHADGTGWLYMGLLVSLWTIASKTATVFGIFADGCRDTILPLFGRCHGTLVSDRAPVLDFWQMDLRQICWAHLLRKFVGFSERDGPARTLGRELLQFAELVFKNWHNFKKGELTREELKIQFQPVRLRFENTLQSAVSAKIPRLSGSCEDMLKYREAFWNFVDHEGVEPTNNHAERELRGFVLWRKGCFGSQSERGLRFAERVMTVAHTARKQGKGILDFITRSLIAQLGGLQPPKLIDPA